MERIMRSQAMGDARAMEYMRGRKILEVNPSHEILRGIKVGGRFVGRCSLGEGRFLGRSAPRAGVGFGGRRREQALFLLWSLSIAFCHNHRREGAASGLFLRGLGN
jgi:hypothetical protein